MGTEIRSLYMTNSTLYQESYLLAPKTSLVRLLVMSFCFVLLRLYYSESTFSERVNKGEV